MSTDHNSLSLAVAEEQPWTEAHQREAFVRLCELAIELVARDDSCKYQLAHAASCRNVNEYWFRVALGNAFDPARIDAEVAIVRQRAAGPAVADEARELRDENARLRAELREIADGPDDDAATAAEAALGSRAEASDPSAWSPPDGTTVDPLHGSLEGPLLVALVTIEPGKEWPREVHSEHEETAIVVVGHATAVIDDELMDVPAGRLCFARCGQHHAIRNTSETDPATYLSILRRILPAVSPMAESVPPDSAEEG